MFGNILQGAKNYLGQAGKAIGGAVQNVGTQLKALPQLAQRYIAPPKPQGTITPYAQAILARPPQQQQQTQWTPPQASPPVNPYTNRTTTTGQSSSTGYGTYKPPAMGQYGVSSQEEAAKRMMDEQMAKYNEMIAPKYGELSSYMSSRRPFADVYQEQLGAQGATQKGQMLSDVEKEIIEQQELLRTVPEEDVARRQETGG